MAYLDLDIQYDDKTDTYRSEYYNFTASTQVLHEVMKASGLTLSDAFRELVQRSTMGGPKPTLQQILDELGKKNPLTQEEQDALLKYTAAARQRRYEERKQAGTTGPPPVTMRYTDPGPSRSVGVPGGTWVPGSSWDSSESPSLEEACWNEVVKTWQACQDAHYEPEEIGDILYTLVEELLQRKVPE